MPWMPSTQSTEKYFFIFLFSALLYLHLQRTFMQHTLGKELLKNNKIKTTDSSKRFLRSAIGTFTFKEQYAGEIASQWISEIEVLSQIAKEETPISLLQNWCMYNYIYTTINIICTNLICTLFSRRKSTETCQYKIKTGQCRLNAINTE